MTQRRNNDLVLAPRSPSRGNLPGLVRLQLNVSEVYTIERQREFSD